MALFPQWLWAHFCSNQGCLLCLLDLAEHLEGGALLLMTRSQAFQFACVSGEGKPLDSGVRSREGLRVLEPEAPNGPSDAVVSSVPPERRPGYRVPASSFPWRTVNPEEGRPRGSYSDPSTMVVAGDQTSLMSPWDTGSSRTAVC